MTGSGRYILDAEGQPVLCDDLMTWARWIEKADRKLARDEPAPDIVVSTVFLGVDHDWGDGPPILWETMILVRGKSLPTGEQMRAASERIRQYLRGEPVEWPPEEEEGFPLDGEQWRYRSREEALAGHAAALALVKAELALALVFQVSPPGEIA